MSATTYPNVYNGTLLDEIIHEQKLSRDLVKKAAREVFAIIKEGLVRDGVVRINHFGSFKLKRVAARKGRNPQTGEAITIPGHAKVLFSPCKALREMIEPVHAKPIPIPAPVIEPVQAKEPKRAAVQPVPELIPEPALLKTESEASTVIERVADFEEEPERRKRGKHEKLIYFGIAATIIAMVAIKSVPRKVETPLQQATETAVVEPMVVTELEMKPVDTPPAAEPEIVPVDTATAEVAKPEAESELAQIIASQSEQPSEQRIELEAATEPTMPVPSEELVAVTEEVIAEEQPTAAIAESGEMVSVEAPVVAETVAVEEASVITPEIFFAERPYKLQSGNSLWRLSDRFYNEPLYWPHIFYANSATITNPDRLFSGRTITMPTLEGKPGSLTKNDREGIAEGYFLTYLYYKESGHKDAFFALLEAKRYSAEVVESKRHTLTLSAVENIMLDQQEVVANL